MTRIQAHPLAERELQTRGVDTNVGVFGEHKVQLGKSAAIRLDSIKSANVPFAGFRRATKLNRGQAGLTQTSGAALKVLARPSGVLRAGGVLGNFKALRTHLTRLQNLGEIPAGHEDTQVLHAMAPAVEKLSNQDLTAVWQTFMSAEMDLLQTGLRYEGSFGGSADARAAASDLMDTQALVLKEISNRIARGENMEGSENLPSLSQSIGVSWVHVPEEAPLASEANANAQNAFSHAHIRVLTEVSAQSATTREQMGNAFASDMSARRLEGLSAQAMGNIMRSAELTMNLDANFLFGVGLSDEQLDMPGSPVSSILSKPGVPMQNIHHLHDQGMHPKGEGYIAPRNEAEKLLFPELFTQETLNPDARPIYAALNMDHSVNGAADVAYGAAVIVFKPEVAQRATYMVDDTFYEPAASFTRERRDNFYLRLKALDDGQQLPEGFAREAAQPDSDLHRAFEEYFDSLDVPNAKIDDFNAPLHPTIGARIQDNSKEYFAYLHSQLIAAFGDHEATRARMATFDSLESLLPGMATPTLGSLARAAMHNSGAQTQAIGLGGTRYIEAQIQGGVLPAQDIAEIRVPASYFPRLSSEQRAHLIQRFTDRTGIKVILVSSDTSDRDITATSTARQESSEFSGRHFSTKAVNDMVNASADNLNASIKTLLPDLAHIELRGNIKEIALGKFRALTQKWLTDPGARPRGVRSFSNEEVMVKTAFRSVFKPILEHRAALLKEVDNLHFDNVAQKENFIEWMMSAKELRSVEEVRLVHAGATTCYQTLRTLADADPEPSPLDVTRAISGVVQDHAEAMQVFLGGLPAADQGPDDKFLPLARFASLGISMLSRSSDGKEAVEKLSALLGRPEQNAVFSQINVLLGRSLVPLNVDDDRERFEALSALCECIRNNAHFQANKPLARIPDFVGELSLIPVATRDILREIAPVFIGYLDQAHPAYPEFPAPMHGHMLPQTDAERRNFLVRLLDVNGPYLNNERTFERGTSVHGRGHIARTYIFATTFCNILASEGVSVDRNAVLMGIAGHDMGRLGGGTDYWEGQSATALVEAVRANFGEDSAGNAYEQELHDCIHGHRSHTLECLLLNAADSLDIGRVRDFDIAYFDFLRGHQAGTQTPEEQLGFSVQTMRQRLVAEATMLQRMTDSSFMGLTVSLHIQRLQVEALNNGNIEAADYYKEMQKTHNGDIAADYANHFGESGEEYMANMEKIIHDNLDLFPLLSRYYPKPSVKPSVNQD